MKNTVETSLFVSLEPELQAAQHEVEQLRQEVEKLKKYGKNISFIFIFCRNTNFRKFDLATRVALYSVCTKWA